MINLQRNAEQAWLRIAYVPEVVRGTV